MTTLTINIAGTPIPVEMPAAFAAAAAGRSATIAAAAATEAGEALVAVNDAGDARILDIAAAATARIGEVDAAGAAQVSAVEAEGTDQIAAVEAEGAEQIALATAQAVLAASAAGSVVRANLLELEDGIDRPRVMTYSSGANRWRLTASGYVIAAANEERRCFGADGSYLGNAMERGDTYFAPPLNNKTAYAGTADLRRFDITNLGTDVRSYPGEHSAPDIFGSTGAGMRIVQGNSTNAFGSFTNVSVPVLTGQTFIIEEGITIDVGAAGQVAVRSAGGRSYGFVFNHDAEGQITGFTESWGTYIADFDNGRVINGKRRVSLHVLTTATANGNVVPGFGWPGANAGRGITVDWVKVRVLPVAAANNFPVFGTLASAQVVLTDDAIDTGLGAGFGYIMQDTGYARSVMPNGRITVPAILFGGSLSPIERKIRVVRSPTTIDRAGPIHTGKEDLHFRPWLSSGQSWTRFAGPGVFPNQVGWNTVGSNCSTLSITPVFAERAPDLSSLWRNVNTSQTYISAGLNLSNGVLHAATHNQAQMWQQSELPASSGAATFWLAANTDINLAGIVGIGCPVEHTRARHFSQEDATRKYRQYCGEIITQTFTNGSTVTFENARLDSFARISPTGNTAATAFTLNCENTFQNHIWSDNWFPGQGVITCQFRNVVQGPGSAQSMDFYQSRREVLVNLLDGNGWQTLAAAGKTVANLPYGRRAKHVGTFDFGTLVEIAAPEHGESCMVRNFEPASGLSLTKPGQQWNASQVKRGDHTRFPRIGDVFVLTGLDRVTGQPMQVKITADLGLYNGSNVWVPGVNPAVFATGTHPDHMQINRFSVTMTFSEWENVFMFGEGQGPFLTGDPALGASGSIVTSFTLSKMAVVLSTSNGLRWDHLRAPLRTLTLRQSIFLQEQNPYRYASPGPQVRMTIGAAGVNCALDVDATVVISGDSEGTGGIGVSSGATLVGTPTFVPSSSISNYSTVTDPTAKPQMRDLVEPQFIDPVSRLVVVPEDFTEFRWSAYAETLVGWALNQTFIDLCAYHKRRSGRFIAEWERLFLDSETANVRLIVVPNNTAVGTVLATGVLGSEWHWFWGAARNGWVALDGQGRIVLARSLTGVNRMLSPMMTSAEEVYIFDVVAP